jgi:hypothetical protein
MKVKLQNEDELVGYVSVKKFANQPNHYKYKLTWASVMASQSSDNVVRSGFVQAESEQDAVRQVTAIVQECSEGVVAFENERFRQWCVAFFDNLRQQFPTSTLVTTN